MKISHRIGLTCVLAALPLMAAACGGQQPPPEVPTTEVPPAPAGSATAESDGPVEIKDSPKKAKPAAEGDAGADKENPVMRCGPGDSYKFVAGYECSDGTRPLGGDPRAGGAARRGNVGANSKGHVIDLYVIPCSSGPVEVYVDMYGCPEYEKMLIGK
jgi:hypothetical protein